MRSLRLGILSFALTGCSGGVLSHLSPAADPAAVERQGVGNATLPTVHRARFEIVSLVWGTI